MRFEHFELARFGIFTGTTLDLSAPGVHVVVGPNEAGKTTAMAGIEQLLYGIPTRTTHAFIHKMPDLRLAARLADDDGRTLEIVRVKKRTNTLRDPDGETIDDAELATFLHGVTREVFTSLFTIGHAEIVAGGEALLDADGELGQALFSASRGTTDLTAVLRALDDRAGALFKPSGSKPLLNAALGRYTAAVTEANELSMSATAVLDLDAKLAAAEADHDATARQRHALSTRRSLLLQARTARPVLLLRDEHRATRDELRARGPAVAAEVRPGLEAARSDRRDGQAALRTAQAAVQRLDDKLAALTVDTVLLDQQEKIDALVALTGGYDQNEQDRPGLETKSVALAAELDELRKKLPVGCPLDDQGRSVLTVDRAHRIRELAAERSDLVAARKHASGAAREAETTRTGRRDRLAALDEPGDVSALVDVVARIREAGDLEATRVEDARRLDDLDAELTGRLAALGLTGVDPRAVDALAVPAIDVIRRARDDAASHTAAITAVDEKIETVEAEATRTRDQLAELLRNAEPPATADLDDARAGRDRAWRLVRRAWLGDDSDGDTTGTSGDGRDLADAYEATVVDADAIADRLRREAEAVEQRAALEARIADADAELTGLREERETLRATAEAAAADWATLWEPIGVPAAAPADMEAWHTDHRTCVDRSVEARRLAGALADLDDTIARHRTDVTTTLAAVGATADPALSLRGMLDHADRIADEAATATREFRAAEAALDESDTVLVKKRDTLADADAALDDWNTRWASTVTDIGLTTDSSPDEASAVLETLSVIDAKSVEHDGLEHRISGIDERTRAFTEGVAALLGILDAGADPDLADTDPASVVKILARRVADARAEAAKHATTTEERQNHRTAADEAADRIADADRRIAELIDAAGLPDEASLEAAITRGERLAELDGLISDAEDGLKTQLGKQLTRIEAETADLDGVEIEPELEQLDIALEAIDEELKARQTRVGELRNERARVDASGAAADRMTRAQQSLAEVVDHGEEYVRTVLARHLLEEQVTRYREDNQGPLLERARQLFTKLTLDRYIGIDTDADDKGEPILYARTSDDRLVGVSALSTGTRDQLYLALRLAALERFMANRGPLPVVLDDLFVHFDDQRTGAGLGVLDGLAATTQVLLFTHHGRVAEQAAEVITDDRLTLHHL